MRVGDAQVVKIQIHAMNVRDHCQQEVRQAGFPQFFLQHVLRRLVVRTCPFGICHVIDDRHVKVTRKNFEKHLSHSTGKWFVWLVQNDRQKDFESVYAALVIVARHHDLDKLAHW